MLLAAILVAMSGCGSNPEAKSKVDQAVGLIGNAQSLLEDLLSLDERCNDLGTRFPDTEETIAEGKSLAEMALMDVDELESRYGQARDILREVADMRDAGDYAEYARLALAAVDIELEALAVNRQMLTSVWDMLDVLPLAESQEQLSYYTGEIERLTEEVSDLLQQGADAALQADQYYKEHSL
ncbi:MAG: hypothetical protein C4536_03895 [Actinobacteria bacterium]|nr:MAG: hypothetical protein C4536_03895 [Actinomycetota bacterium]